MLLNPVLNQSSLQCVKKKKPKYNKLCSFCFCNVSQEIHCLALTMIDVTEDQLSGGLTNKES